MPVPKYIYYQNKMAAAARTLHSFADAVVNELKDKPVLLEESAAGDDARAALERARRWRALVEGGIA